MESTKPIVRITHILSSTVGIAYFAIPEDYETFPKATWVALGDTEKSWIEVFPIGPNDSAGIDDFSEVSVDIDNSFLPPGTRYPQILGWRC